MASPASDSLPCQPSPGLYSSIPRTRTGLSPSAPCPSQETETRKGRCLAQGYTAWDGNTGNELRPCESQPQVLSGAFPGVRCQGPWRTLRKLSVARRAWAARSAQSCPCAHIRVLPTMFKQFFLLGKPFSFAVFRKLKQQLLSSPSPAPENRVLSSLPCHFVQS